VDTGDLSGQGWRVMVGSCLDRMKELPDASVDAVVTDPPYELGFMGKSWDSSGIAYNVEVWAECLRVLKPGGHLLSFSATRTYHRMTVAIEDAGFEVRDMIAWISNKTFPKSLDVSKAIDKGTGENRARQLRFVSWMRSTGLKAQEINQAIGKADVGSHYLRFDQPAIATADLFDKLRHLLPDVPEEIERLVAERTGIEWTAYKNREVIGERKQRGSQNGVVAFNTADSETEMVTAPATAEAVKWQGWGTALKPSLEPVVMARKPLVGTVAANVLEYGTGALNIDGTRIPSDDGFEKAWDKPVKTNISSSSQAFSPNTGTTHQVDLSGNRPVGGRWPSNVVLDEFTAGLVDEQSGQVKGGTWNTTDGARMFDNDGKPTGYATMRKDDSVGGASRFFYVARASKSDRNEGIESNSHPTVKPTDLMRQLVRLVTPPGGVVLDPFTGSGSTGKAAILEGFEFIGCELTEEYLPIIEGRLNHAVATVKAEQEKEEEKLF
jgi:DNA modification methylase